MKQQTIDPNQMSDTELKAVVYDMSTQLNNLNQGIQTINQIIKERAQARLQAMASTDKTAEEYPIVLIPAE